jgi:hypothetical protein
VGRLSRLLWYIDRAVDWIYDGFAVGVAQSLGAAVDNAQPGNYYGYLLWSLAGLAAVAMFLLK